MLSRKCDDWKSNMSHIRVFEASNHIPSGVILCVILCGHFFNVHRFRKGCLRTIFNVISTSTTNELRDVILESGYYLSIHRCYSRCLKRVFRIVSAGTPNELQTSFLEPRQHSGTVDDARFYFQVEKSVRDLGVAIMVWLVLVVVASLLPCVECDLPTYIHDTVNLKVVTPDSLTMSQSKKQEVPPVRPVVNITAVFEEQDLDDFEPIFVRALADLINDSVTFTWTGHMVSASRDLKAMMTGMCAHFQGDRSQIRLIVVFGSVKTIQTVNLLSEALGIPVIGYMMDKGDGYVQVSITTEMML